MIKDSWTHLGRESWEQDILQNIHGMKWVPQLVAAWTVEIAGSDDQTNMCCSSLPSSSCICVHWGLVMQLVGKPISNFKSIHELLSIFIDILDSMSEQPITLLADLTTSIVHMSLVIQFHILHHDISINNTMMYVCKTAKSKTKKSEGETSSGEGFSHDDESQNDNGNSSEAPSDDMSSNGKGETLEQNLARWDRQRCEQIKTGIFHCGLLIDFDYATNLDQALPMGPGDHTISIPPSTSPPLSLINFDQGTILVFKSPVAKLGKKLELDWTATVLD